MADFSRFHPKLMAYWGVIQNTVSNHATTAQLWNAVKSAAANDGVDLKGVRITDMNQIRSAASAIQRAGETFMKSSPDSVIDSTMVAPDISARPLEERNTIPMYQIRFEHQVIMNGESQTIWETVQRFGDLNVTKEQLLEELEINARVYADDYEYTHTGIGNIQITAV